MVKIHRLFELEWEVVVHRGICDRIKYNTINLISNLKS